MSIFSRLRRDVRGGIALVFALAIVPLMAAAGISVDLARLVVAQTSLQAIVDSSALAGATAYRTAAQSTTATTVASNYFSRNASSSWLSVATPTIAAATGFSEAGYTSYTVSVSVAATMTTTVMGVVGVKTLSLHASAVAANPIVQPIITVSPPGSDAADWNAVYMFAIPTGPNGQPNYSQMPTASNLYEIASNCSAAGDSDWTTQSACNAMPGGTMPVNQTFPAISGTQPLGFLFENMDNAMAPAAGPAIYVSGENGLNYYGAFMGNVMLFNTAWVNSAPGVMSGNSPSYLTDSSATLMPSLTGPQSGMTALNYTTKTHSGVSPYLGTNCSVVIQIVDPNNIPAWWTFYNNSGQVQKCHNPNETATGLQYANLSCAQMNGQTFMYWWNDMGGYPDDFNYVDLYYTVRCVPGFGNPNGGQLYQGTTVPAAPTNLGVSLMK
jgi:Flp pilus assembly protein TadG